MTTETPTTLSFSDERAELLARITMLLIGMGAKVEIDQGRDVGRITKVNNVSVDITTIEEKRNRWDTRPPRIAKVSVTFPMYYGKLASASYPRNKEGQFNLQKLVERLDAITRAQAEADKQVSESQTRSSRNYATTKEVRQEKYGSEFTSDSKRGIYFDSDSGGFSVVLKHHVQSREELVAFLAELEKFIDGRSTS